MFTVALATHTNFFLLYISIRLSGPITYMRVLLCDNVVRGEVHVRLYCAMCGSMHVEQHAVRIEKDICRRDNITT